MNENHGLFLDVRVIDLFSNFIKYSRLYFTISKAMNKIISTKKRVFVSLVGQSGSGKSHLVFCWIKTGPFQPNLDIFFINLINLFMDKC